MGTGGEDRGIVDCFSRYANMIVRSLAHFPEIRVTPWQGNRVVCDANKSGTLRQPEAVAKAPDLPTVVLNVCSSKKR